MISVTAAGGVVYRHRKNRQEIVLIYRNGVWDLPKGKKEAYESIKDCARREVGEEAGSSLPKIEHFLTTSYHEYQRDGKKWAKTTHWFLMFFEDSTGFSPQKEEGITKVQWEEINKAHQLVGYKNLRKVIEKAVEKLKKGPLK